MSCNATTKDRGKLKICSEALHHSGSHRDGDFQWDGDRVHETKRYVTPKGEEST